MAATAPAISRKRNRYGTSTFAAIMTDTANENVRPSTISHAPIDTMERSGFSNRYHISRGSPRSQNSMSAASAKSPKAPNMPHRAQSGTRRVSQPGFARTSITVAHRKAPPAVPARNKYQIAKSLNTRTPSLTTPQYTQPTAQQAKPGEPLRYVPEVS